MVSTAAAVAVGALLLSFGGSGAVPGTDPVAPVVRVQRHALDDALGGSRSFLSFLPASVRSGRFAVTEKAGRVHHAGRGAGTFWRTEGGNAYTRVDPYDAALVARLVGPLAELTKKGLAKAAERGERRDARVYPLAAGLYEGDEFQYTLEDYAARLPVLQPGVVSLGLHSECDDAFAAHRDAIREAVRGLRPAFVRQGGVDRWSMDVTSLRAATATTRHEAEVACRSDSFSDVDRYSHHALVVERTATRVTVRVQWTARWAPDAPESPELTFAVTPGPAGAPPLVPRPADAFDEATDFLLRTNACRALPWEYSNFAAGDSFTRPQSRSYSGPGPFVDGWACERDVEPGDREHAMELEL